MILSISNHGGFTLKHENKRFSFNLTIREPDCNLFLDFNSGSSSLYHADLCCFHKFGSLRGKEGISGNSSLFVAGGRGVACFCRIHERIRSFIGKHRRIFMGFSWCCSRLLGRFPKNQELFKNMALEFNALRLTALLSIWHIMVLCDCLKRWKSVVILYGLDLVCLPFCFARFTQNRISDLLNGTVALRSQNSSRASFRLGIKHTNFATQTLTGFKACHSILSPVKIDHKTSTNVNYVDIRVI